MSWIESAWKERSLLKDRAYAEAVEAVVADLDAGRTRVAEPDGEGNWRVNETAKKAVLLYFAMRANETTHMGPFEFRDKIPLKKGLEKWGVRVVPPAVCRYGAYLAPGVIMMPSYVNIGAWVGEETMVDTWATVGSCAQIGRGVHLSGGVGIGGVLEPPQAVPVVVEDGAFIGSRCVVVEGVRVGQEAVLGAGVVLTASTKIIDAHTGAEYRGYVPPRSVVIPASVPKSYPAGTFHMPCALIIGTRTPATDLKTSLNLTLREYGLAV
jgi:2,3,4,5-tetrahydropyridine-2-carboxylate N-succinyltransferase